MFSQAWCHSFCPQGGLYPSMQWANPGRHTPPPPNPGRPPPPRDGHWSGRYVSYWNAFLFVKFYNGYLGEFSVQITTEKNVLKATIVKLFTDQSTLSALPAGWILKSSIKTVAGSQMGLLLTPVNNPFLTCSSNAFLPRANEDWGKVIFSVACVKNSVHSGCCDMGQNDTIGKIELNPLSSCQVIILIARMTFNCSTSCLMS